MGANLKANQATNHETTKEPSGEPTGKRTEQPSWARELLALLQIDHRFAFSEIYPSSKLRHFNALMEQTDISFDSMLFFDDEMRNIREVSGLGVKSIHLESGIHWEQFQRARNSFGASKH